MDTFCNVLSANGITAFRLNAFCSKTFKLQTVTSNYISVYISTTLLTLTAFLIS
jgi:hypothetical protein